MTKELKQFLQDLCPEVVDGYPSMTPYPNDNGAHYITFGQGGIKEQGAEMPLQTTLDTTTFKQALTEYAQDKKRLLVRRWPTIQQDKLGKYIIRARLVGDDGTLELRND